MRILERDIRKKLLYEAILEKDGSNDDDDKIVARLTPRVSNLVARCGAVNIRDILNNHCRYHRRDATQRDATRRDATRRNATQRPSMCTRRGFSRS